MIDFIAQNFNMTSFALALAFFLIINALGRIGGAYYTMRQTKARAREVEARLQKLKTMLKKKDTQVKAELEKRITKSDNEDR